MWYTYIPNMRSIQASLLEISCLQGFYNVFTIWPLLTPNDPWPPPKTIGFLYLMWHSYIPNMRSVQTSLVEISCLQGFHNLTPVDPKWPLTSTKNNRLLVLNVVHLHTKYEICPSFHAWDIVFTMFLQCFHNLTPVDPKWPLTSTKNNRLLVLNVALLHTKYEICPSFPSWDIVFTSRRHDTHTYTHIHTHIHTHTHTHTHTYIHTHTRQHEYKGYDYHRNQKWERRQ